jgi:hypothetical protein
MSRTLPNHPASKCHPSVLPAAGPIEVGTPVGVVLVGVVGVVDTVGLVVADPVGFGELLVADAEGDVLLDGSDCVGVGDCRPLDVGPADLLARGVFDADPRLVPVPLPPAVVAGTEAVVGVATVV